MFTVHEIRGDHCAMILMMLHFGKYLHDIFDTRIKLASDDDAGFCWRFRFFKIESVLKIELEISSLLIPMPKHKGIRYTKDEPEGLGEGGGGGGEIAETVYLL